MANGWGQYAAYLEALAKQKNPQYTPVTPVTQADMGEAVDAPAPVPFSAPLVAPMPQGAQREPAGVAALAKKRVPAAAMARPGSTFEERAPQEDMDALRKLLGIQQADADKLRSQAESVEVDPGKADLSPLMALADAWGNQGGAKLSSLYDKPMKPEERQAMAAKLRNLASDNEQGIAKDRIQMLLGGDKNDMSIIKQILAGQQRQLASSQPNWRTDSLINRAVNDIHRAPNLKTYTDMANSVAEGNYLLGNNPSVMEANEALTTLTRAIGRTSVSSDYRQKQLESKTLQEWEKKLKIFITSNPNEPAPPELVKLLKKVSGRVLDTYDVSIRREANRVAQGKRFSNASVSDAVEEAKNHYTSGDYMKELRATYGIGEAAIAPGRPPANVTAVEAANELPADWDEAKKKKYLELKAKAGK